MNKSNPVASPSVLSPSLLITKHANITGIKKSERKDTTSKRYDKLTGVVFGHKKTIPATQPQNKSTIYKIY